MHIIISTTRRAISANAAQSFAFHLLAISDYSLLRVVCFGGWFVQDKCITFSSPIAPPFRYCRTARARTQIHKHTLLLAPSISIADICNVLFTGDLSFSHETIDCRV
jgi:hypothetical protein